MAAPSFASLKSRYRKLWDSTELNAGRVAVADNFVRKILAGRGRYMAVSKATGVPWYFIAVTHMRESSCNFAGVLHNGEHIIGTGKKTRLVPAGRGPFTSWESAAIDALKLHGLHRIAAWSIERVLYECERFNGWGYYRKGRFSPYVWAGTQHYKSGKYVADGEYDLSHVDTQLGCAIVLKRLEAIGGVNVDAHAPTQPLPDVERDDEPDFDPPKPAGKSKTFWSSVLGILMSIWAVIEGAATNPYFWVFLIVVVIFGYIIWERLKRPDIFGWFR